MNVRMPKFAGSFYPDDAYEIRRQIRAALEKASVQSVGHVVGGIVPHAGWVFSGGTAAYLFKALSLQPPPEVVILFGAVHTWGVHGACVYGVGAWRTPLGTVEIDEVLAKGLLTADERFRDRPQAHADEHSIEVQVPFIQYLWPEARILPIAMPPILEAPSLGRTVAQVVRELGRQAVAIGSSDLTHYGPRYGLAPVGVGPQGLAWAKENDRRLLSLVVNLRADEVLIEAAEHHNACGAGAIAAAIGYALEAGAMRGILLHHTTSYEVLPVGRPADLVGYGAVAFVAP